MSISARVFRDNLLLQEATKAIPLFSPVIVPMAQNIGPLISQLMASPTMRYGVRIGLLKLLSFFNLLMKGVSNIFGDFCLQAEMAIKNLQNLSPPFLKQVLPLVEQLPPLYMDLANGKDSFIPHPDETRQLVSSSIDFFGISMAFIVKNGFWFSFNALI